MLYINGQEQMDKLDVKSIENTDELKISNVNIIPEGKFTGLRNLKNITLENVSVIEPAAFMDCKKLKNIYFLNNPKEIKDFAFNNTQIIFLEELYSNIIFGVYNNVFNDLNSLENTPWYIINELAIRNIAHNYFDVGDTKKIQVGNYNYDFVILDFKHDDLADGSGRAGITFGAKQLYNKLHCMDRSGHNCYSWIGSSLRKHLIEECYYEFPEEIRKIMKNVIKKTSCNEKIVESSDSLFSLSEKELCNMSRYSFPNIESEGYLYKYYEDAINRYKRKIDTSYTTLYWLRSPRRCSETDFVHSWVSDSCGSQLATTQLGIDLNFCI